MDETARTIVWLFMFVLITGMIVVTVPTLFLAITAFVPLLRRHGLSTAIAYFATMLILGFLVYSFVPNQYTKYFNFASGVHSNSLGSIHAEFLERTANPTAISPERAPAIIQMVHEERAEFSLRWLGLTLGVGLLGIVICARLTGKRLGNPFGSLHS